MSMVLPCSRNYFNVGLGSWFSIIDFVLGRHGFVVAMVSTGLSGAAISEISMSFQWFQELQSSDFPMQSQK